MSNSPKATSLAQRMTNAMGVAGSLCSGILEFVRSGSGGMVKRAAFARAIIMDPKILFCDEPSAGLDPVVASALDDLILDMRAAMGMTIVVVTHELESAFKIADRLTILDKGHILMIGTVDEVRKSKNERVQNLLNRMPEDDTARAES